VNVLATFKHMAETSAASRHAVANRVGIVDTLMKMHTMQPRVHEVLPCSGFVRAFWQAHVHTSSSNPLRGRDWRYATCTSAPKRLKMPANSTAMYPPPMMVTFLQADQQRRYCWWVADATSRL
jgi:hypothetical protein